MPDNLVPFIEFRGAGKQYDGKYAVRELDFTIYQGEWAQRLPRPGRFRYPQVTRARS